MNNINVHHLQKTQVVFYLQETEVEQIEKDIFEDVREAASCEYISDLPGRQEEVIKTISRIDLTGYPKKQIIAFRKYMCMG